MKVFISWSGADTRALAESLRKWLPRMLLTNVEAFVSSQDIEKGQRGLNVIAEQLAEIDYGLVVLTKSNQNAPWINFEAGALGKSLGVARLSPLLLDLTQADVTGPLQQFQMTSLTDKEDVWKLLTDMNKLLENAVPEDSMRVLFESAWGDLETATKKALKGGGPAKTTRPPEDMLEEILYRVRRIERPLRVGPAGLSRLDEKDLIGEVFSCITGSPVGETRAGVKMTSQGVTVTVSTPEESEIDLVLLQRVADRNDVKIEIEAHDIVVYPRGRFRDPSMAARRAREARNREAHGGAEPVVLEDGDDALDDAPVPPGD